MHGLLVEGGAHAGQQAVCQRQQFGVLRAELTGFGHPGLQVLVDHRQRALREVAELVGQIGVDPADDAFLAVTAVLTERDLAQQEVANLVHPERLHQRHRIDDVADRLAHLLATVVEEPVREHPAGQRDSGRHQERRPVHGVEPDDVLADHVQIGRPKPLVQSRRRVREPDPGEVVRQRVHPHVHDVCGITGHRHTPVERRARDRQVRQAAGDEADDLVAPRLRRDELRIGGVVRQQRFGVGRQPEEVGLFLGPGDRRPGLGGNSAAVLIQRRLVLGEEPFVTHRVPAGVGVQVDVAVGGHPLPDHRRGHVVVRVGGADEPVEGDVEQFL